MGVRKTLWVLALWAVALGCPPLLAVASASAPTAQAPDFNPTNPPDPSARYQLTVTVEPEQAGYASGGGKYATGTVVSVATSARAGYTFVGWTKNGESVSSQQQYRYTTTNEHVTLVAHYRYNPVSPADPQTSDTYRLYLNTNQAGCCTFNLVSGVRIEAGQTVTVAAQNVSAGFKFNGWYADGELLSTSLRFSYVMPRQDTVLEARFSYDPDSPADPNSNQDDVDNDERLRGDVNGDGHVNVGDIMAVINYMAGQTTGIEKITADVNGDGHVNVGDIMAIINIMAAQ